MQGDSKQTNTDLLEVGKKIPRPSRQKDLRDTKQSLISSVYDRI